jgi:hypothetical protein
VFRETFPYLARSRFIDRAFTTPRGYASDVATIDMLYEDTAEGDGRLGPLIDRWTRELPAARAVRNRRALLAEAIREVAATWPGGWVPVTSLAAGPARELFDALTGPDAPRVVATCIDIDPQALEHAAATAQRLGVADRFTFVRDNVVRLARGRGHTSLGPQALIYSVGLTDYLQDDAVVDLLDWAYDQLLPGGTFIIGNVVPSNPNKAYMDHILEWVLIHRSAEQLRRLFARSRFGTTPVALRTEPAGADLFALCRKTRGRASTRHDQRNDSSKIGSDRTGANCRRPGHHRPRGEGGGVVEAGTATARGVAVEGAPCNPLIQPA